MICWGRNERRRWERKEERVPSELAEDLRVSFPVKKLPDETARVDRSKDHDEIGAELIVVDEGDDRLRKMRMRENKEHGEEDLPDAQTESNDKDEMPAERAEKDCPEPFLCPDH